MIYLLVLVVFAVVIFYLGIVVGIADCKRTFNIPKGIKSLMEYEDYMVNDFLARGIFEDDTDGCNNS